jgi:hypothetical protein
MAETDIKPLSAAEFERLTELEHLSQTDYERFITDPHMPDECRALLDRWYATQE